MILTLVAVLVFYIIVSILAGHQILTPRISSRTTYRIPLTLHANSSLSPPSVHYTVPFTLGLSSSIPLILSTGTSDILLRPNIYAPSPRSDDLYYSESLNFTLESGITTGLEKPIEVETDAVTDTVGTGGLDVLGVPFGILGEGSEREVKGVLPEGVGGIVGFGIRDGGFVDGFGEGLSWVARLGKWSQIPENRFGVALKSRAKLARLSNLDNQSDGETANNSTDGGGDSPLDGTLFIGGLDTSSLSGDLVSARFTQSNTYTIAGMLGVANEPIPSLSTQTFTFATGTQRIYGPRTSVLALFDILKNTTGSDFTYLDGDGKVVGFFSCDSPPEVQFAFPYNVTAGDPGRVWGVEEEVMGWEEGVETGGGTCRCVIEGMAELDAGNGHGRWIMGHAFMVGKYIDFDLDGQTIGIGMLQENDG